MTDRQPGDTMRERAGESRAKLWVFLDADRRLVALGGLAFVFLSLVAVGVALPGPSREQLLSGDPVETAFQALITAIVTGVTLVVTLNQLVLSQELGPVGDQRDRLEGAMGFRGDVEAALDAPVSPPDPASFLQSLVELVRRRAEALRSAAGDDDGPVEAYADAVSGNAAAVSEQLEGARFGTFDVLSAALDFNYSWKIYEARRLRAARGDDLDDAARAAVDDVVDTLSLFGPAREHFKTLYFQWELIDLSRMILYAAFPALVVALCGVFFLGDPGIVEGSVAGIDAFLVVVSLAVTVALSPFVLLLAYILRIATVAKRTLAIGPFVLRDTRRGGREPPERRGGRDRSDAGASATGEP